MTRTAARAVSLDASVLVKLFVTEPHSAAVRDWVEKEPSSYATPFCFYEALNIFKAKWKFQDKISQDDYVKASTGLAAWFGGKSRAGYVNDPDLVSPEAFVWVREVVKHSQLDFSDAYQIYSVKNGYFSHAAGESRTVLATTDGELARVARMYGLLAVDLRSETEPT